MICFRRWLGWLGWLSLLLVSLSACQPLLPKFDTAPTEATALDDTAALDAAASPAVATLAQHTIAHEITHPPVDWAAAQDCLGKLALPQRGMDEGLIIGLEDSPFRLITDDPLDMREDWRAAGASAASRQCVIRVGRALT